MDSLALLTLGVEESLADQAVPIPPRFPLGRRIKAKSGSRPLYKFIWGLFRLSRISVASNKCLNAINENGATRRRQRRV